MSLGEDRVRIKFNPSDDSLVSQIKQKSAELIDLCEQNKLALVSTDKNFGAEFPKIAEVNRLWSIAQTYYEDAAMWAVKAATS